MSYTLRENLSFCRTDGRLIFLDTQADQYFCLPPAVEQRFIAHWEQGDDEHVGDLVERAILIRAQGTSRPMAAEGLAPPVRSPMERSVDVHCRPIAVAEVLVLICRTQWHLRTRPLQRILDELVAYRRDQQSSSSPDVDPDHLAETIEAANLFRAARLYAPIETCCLLDSLAMTRFLARRHLYARIVFAVMGDPFSAHCWVQLGDIVLNDTVGHANAHTPIRVI